MRQSDLARALSVSAPTVCGWERGESPTWKNIERIAEACGVNVTAFFGPGAAKEKATPKSGS